MENTPIIDPGIAFAPPYVPGFAFNAAALCDAIAHLRENDPKYAKMSIDEFAMYIGISVSTLKKIKRGEITDPRCSSLWLLCKALPLDPKVLLGLADHPGCSRVPDRHAQDTIEDLRKRISELERLHDADGVEIKRLHDKLLEKSELKSAAESKAATLEEMLRAQDRIIQRNADTIREMDERLENKRGRIEQLEREIGHHQAGSQADARVVGNLEGLCRRHRIIQRWLFGVACVCAMLAISMSAAFVYHQTARSAPVPAGAAQHATQP